MKLPMFPLQSIFFPGETVPLHIFEERYKQLIQDCRNDAVTFGIPVYINDSIHYGIEVQLVEVVNTYAGGEMDVTCVARQVDSDDKLKQQVLRRLEKLYQLMDVPFTPVPLEKFHSFVLVHKMGLSFEQEYELLQITKESERLKFIKDHLTSTISVLQEVDRTKLTIKLNGNFKNFDPLDFDDFKI